MKTNIDIGKVNHPHFVAKTVDGKMDEPYFVHILACVGREN